jgi:hypothetical protein
MNTVIKALPLLAASLGMFHVSAIPAAPVAINDYLGNWTATAAPYAAGNVVSYSSKTWLSLVDGNTKKPGAAGTSNQWRLGDAKTFVYDVGDKGPGGGWIFFVDEKDRYPGFTYLEAAQEDVGTHPWCDKTNVSIPGANGEAAWALGRGKANTKAMLAVCTSGAANVAAAYRGPNNKTDWYLPSIGELNVVYTKLVSEQGKGGFGAAGYWSSSEADKDYARSKYSAQAPSPVTGSLNSFASGLSGLFKALTLCLSRGVRPAIALYA